MNTYIKRIIVLLLMAVAMPLMAEAQDLSRVRELMAQLEAELQRLEAQRAELEAREAERARLEAADSANQAQEIFPEAATDPEAIERMRQEEPRRIASSEAITTEPIDTLNSAHEAVKIILYNDNTWRYVRDRAAVRDSEIYTRYWDTLNVLPYRELSIKSFPESIAIDLVDSIGGYHYPYKGTIKSYGKFGPRRRRPHRGIDLSLKMGDPIYATFSGKVRISQYNRGGYGNLVVIRHDNGLETYYGHLSERKVVPGQWVEAGQIIGLGGSTGRSSGPHLHFETRYYGQTFDPERLIDFETGDLRRQTIVLRRSYFDIHSNAGQDFEEEIALEEEIRQAEAERAAMRYHTIRSGDTLGAIARKYGTTVTNICRLNGIKSTTVLQIGRKLRVR
uniref:peptidoglycan DD-metalloendopeptidase family protein n=1 Tax=Alistipes sp. TaxID=1872444 RepID=UPI0040579507